MEKLRRILLADHEKLQSVDGMAVVESIEAVFQPQVIASIKEITDSRLSEPGRPYYFKIRSIYKGYDTTANKAHLQDLGSVSQDNGMLNSNTMNAIFGVDTTVYSMPILAAATAATLPDKANSIATFYLIAVKITDAGHKSAFFIRYIRDIENPRLDPSKFMVARGMRYITLDDAPTPNQQDVMPENFFSGAAGNQSSSVFDPMVYSFVDLFDARIAMDKKGKMNKYTFPTVGVKYVSEVVFKGWSGTTITVSTSDDALTERMNFGAPTLPIKAGDRIRVYYTIAKDPFEIWDVQALERL